MTSNYYPPYSSQSVAYHPYNSYSSSAATTPSPDSPPLDTAMTGRKLWKTLKSSKEVKVWPPDIEAKLIEALEHYKSSSERGAARKLQRFPRRNRYISEYILNTTGVLRTAKQVGSRLQQLRDTCSDARIKGLIVRELGATSPPHPSSSSRSSSKAADSPSSPDSPGAVPTEPSSTPASKRANSLAADSPSSVNRVPGSPPLALDDVGQDPFFADGGIYLGDSQMDPRISDSSASDWDFKSNVLIELQSSSSGGSRASAPPLYDSWRKMKLESANGELWMIHPSVTFVSKTPYASPYIFASFIVKRGDVVVHAERTHLACMPSSTAGPHTYRTHFIPGYWTQLSMSTEMNEYTVQQDIVETRLSEDSSCDERKLLRVIYHFLDTRAHVQRNNTTQDGFEQEPFSYYGAPEVEPAYGTDFPAWTPDMDMPGDYGNVVFSDTGALESAGEAGYTFPWQPSPESHLFPESCNAQHI
ncbi:hypothetical protein CYLTODRAFT_458802 [Cylindrobasidium torrendii FP15055 ss-10]|uniref:TEA domain-containing protein n=1 Tax=Cylindrobasidium torrendii FP15055 ss-10 TaxID=1314674 RepID=A0A0D7AW97_9AGAR|nr:hypothetical protein CYLTODRAFT_458802 [Cylindrobasidium torrendii FP15055 ss-10]